MLLLRILAALGCLMGVACNSPLPPRLPRPPIIESALFRPEFVTPSDSWFGGTGFFATHATKTYCLWAHHLYDSEVEVLQHEVTAWVVLEPENGISCQPLVVRGAGSSGTGNDIAMGLPGTPPTSRLEIAQRSPVEGDHVWMLAETMDSESLVFDAVVTSVDDGEMSYDFYDHFALQATSGAPVLNDEGQVIGINLGGGRLFGRTFGFATVVSDFVRMTERIEASQN